MVSPRLSADTIRTSRLVLEPLRIDHAEEAASVFADDRLHAFTGGVPAGATELRRKYTRQVLGRSPDGVQTWLNWMVRTNPEGELVGTVQATVEPDETAEVSWVIAVGHQGRGYAREAAMAMVEYLRTHGTKTVIAHIHPQHDASAGVARALGLKRTNMMIDGEERWADERHAERRDPSDAAVRPETGS